MLYKSGDLSVKYVFRALMSHLTEILDILHNAEIFVIYLIYLNLYFVLFVIEFYSCTCRFVNCLDLFIFPRGLDGFPHL